MPWILKEQYPGEEPTYFKQWTEIGPACTKDITEAACFSDADAARRSLAFTFAMTFFEPVELPEEVSDAG